MTFRASKNAVTLKTGKVVPLDHSLIVGMRRPPGGWTAKFRINGVDKIYSGMSPQEVARAVLREHQKNSVILSTADLWLNLNLQWMDRLDQKYFLVNKSELTGAILQEGQTIEPTQRRTITPEYWGSIAWKWLGLFLAQDVYEPDAFLQELERVLDMLNPSANPTLGCLLCYGSFAETVQSVRLNPPPDREAARRFLFAYHNSVNVRLNKQPISWDRARALNFWI